MCTDECHVGETPPTFTVVGIKGKRESVKTALAQALDLLYTAWGHDVLIVKAQEVRLLMETYKDCNWMGAFCRCMEKLLASLPRLDVHRRTVILVFDDIDDPDTERVCRQRGTLISIEQGTTLFEAKCSVCNKPLTVAEVQCSECAGVKDIEDEE